MNINISKKDFKSIVKQISDKVKEDDVNISYSEILEIASKACGFKNYNTIKSYFSKFKKEKNTFCLILYSEDNKIDFYPDEEGKSTDYSKKKCILNEINKKNLLKENESYVEVFQHFDDLIILNENFHYSLYNESLNIVKNDNVSIKNLLFYNTSIRKTLPNYDCGYNNYVLLNSLYSSKNFYYYCFNNFRGKINKVEELLDEILNILLGFIDYYKDIKKTYKESYLYHNFCLLYKKFKSFDNYQTCIFENNKVNLKKEGI